MVILLVPLLALLRMVVEALMEPEDKLKLKLKDSKPRALKEVTTSHSNNMDLHWNKEHITHSHNSHYNLLAPTLTILALPPLTNSRITRHRLRLAQTPILPVQLRLLRLASVLLRLAVDMDIHQIRRHRRLRGCCLRKVLDKELVDKAREMSKD